MAFEYINTETGDILDILEARTSRVIKNHFIAPTIALMTVDMSKPSPLI
ncbi:hypothetical protein ACS127_16555 [Amphibacillus sp. Q70]